MVGERQCFSGTYCLSLHQMKREDHNKEKKVCFWLEENHTEALSEQPIYLTMAKIKLHISEIQFDIINATTSLIKFIYNRNMW